jgi:prephenate dehydratase
MKLGETVGQTTQGDGRLRIGIQGVKASFHDVAAREYFAGREIECVECQSFRRLCETLKNGETDFLIMAIENSIAGSILPNYVLLEQFHYRVIGEVYLRIEHCLMALEGQELRDIQIVQSHPMALAQCQEFLARHPWMKAQEAADTAESAKDIKEKNLRGVAAIASRLAAREYGLKILEEGIETDKQNYTRFLVVSNGRVFRENQKPDKASLRFEIPHRPGSLLSVLSSFVAHGINMTKLQSVPILGRPYQYSFHVDIEWEDEAEYQQAIKELKLKTSNMIHFGEYAKNERPVALASKGTQGGGAP